MQSRALCALNYRICDGGGGKGVCVFHCTEILLCNLFPPFVFPSLSRMISSKFQMSLGQPFLLP